MRKSFTVSFLDRSFNAAAPPPGLSVRATRYSRRDMGGCMTATLSARGNEAALWSLNGWLRYGVEVRDEAGTLVWWGFISTVSITTGRVTVSFSIDDMINRVRVSYVKRRADNSVENAITLAADDTFSQGYYGAIKERVLRAGDMSQLSAEALRDDTLRTLKYFSGALEVGNDSPEPTAMIECRGWWSVLNWRYLTQPNPDQSHYIAQQYGPYGFGSILFPGGFTNGATGTDEMALGGDTSNATAAWAFAQRIQISTSGAIHPVRVKPAQFWLALATAAPSFSFAVKMYADNAGNIGAELGTLYTSPASAVSNNYDWQPSGTEVDTMWVIPGRTYWFSIEQLSVNPDTSKFVNVMGTNVSGYNGSTREKILSSSGWTAPRQALDYFNLNVNCEHNEMGLAIGATTAKQQIAQSFQILGSRPSVVAAIKLRGLKAQLPADDLLVDICADSAGSPGAALVTATIDPADIPTTFDEFTAEFAPVLLTPGTTYHIKIRRFGAIDDARFFVLASSWDPATAYALGSLKSFDGSTWSAVDQNPDLLFELLTQQQTTDQIIYAVTDTAPLLTGTDIQNVSGLYENSARDGENTALAEVERWLERGTTNKRRLLAEVEPTRMVRVWEAPVDTAGAAAYINREGSLSTAVGERIDHLAPVGVWVAPRDIAPANAPFAPVDSATLFYIEECEFDIASGLAIPRIRGQRDPFKLGGIET